MMRHSNSERIDEELYQVFGNLINPAHPNYLKRLGLNNVAVKAEGVTITDSEGKTYLDCIAGYGLLNIGHNHPGAIKALKEQIDKKELFTKPFISEIQVRLAEKLKDISPDDLSCSFICNSGSEAIDSSIKLARLSKKRPEIIAANNSFHGYTFGALSVSGSAAFTKQFQPLVPGINHVPFGDTEAVEKSITSETAAVLLEVIQHESGVVLPPDDYFKNVSNICNERDVILIVDEIKTGFGKTGKMFAIENYNISPDILVVGKSLGGGLMPVSAMIAKKKIWRKFGLSFSMSASSFAGNVLSCSAALATIEIIHKDGLIENCRKMGKILVRGLNKFIQQYPKIVKNVCGIGLLVGIEFAQPGMVMNSVKEMIDNGVLVAPAFGNKFILMIEPPLGINEEQIQTVINTFGKACEKLMTET